jgi:endonuclease/exonuclease/phosphatase (EEP) superfamily protein YafD
VPAAIRLGGWCYVAALLVWFGLRLIFFDRFWWLALLNTLALYLFVPLALILPLALLYRQRRLACWLLLPCLLFALLFAPLLNPLKLLSRPADVQPDITAMSFNVLYLNGDYAAMAGAIQQAQPDVIGLQEASPRRIRALLEVLGSSYPYSAIPPPESKLSVGLISRLPIERVEILPDAPMRNALRVTVRAGERRLSVIVTHLAPNNMPLWPPGQFVALTAERYARRAAEVAFLRQVVQARSLPTLILCDCNMTDTSEAYAALREVVADSFQERGWGLGHTVSARNTAFLVQRVDYIWHTNELGAVEAYVGAAGGSDHLPVVARLRLRRP